LQPRWSTKNFRWKKNENKTKKESTQQTLLLKNIFDFLFVFRKRTIKGKEKKKRKEKKRPKKPLFNKGMLLF
jgi:hypothetical protein